MSVDVKMNGLEELRKRLEGMANAEAIKKEALEKSGEHLRGNIENSTPVKTGALKAAIVKGEVVNGEIFIGPSQQGPAYRAHFLEFGKLCPAA
ncbi:MAG: HK97 gp10 family phage protein [Planococcaceae bacterium]|nr:HK97 gp10 family phage protein [Planococcaceae bacterium]